MRLRILLAALAVVSAFAAIATTAAADPNNNNSRKLREAVTVEAIRGHQAALQAIATAHGGTRAAGTAGYDASVDYAVGVFEAAGYDVTVQPFPFAFFQQTAPSVFQQVAPNPTTYVEDTDFGTMTYSGSGNVTAPVTAVDLSLADPAASTSGCEAADYAGFPAGNIALVQRGTCTFRAKADNAQTAGATGLVVFNQGTPDRIDLFFGTLGSPGVTVPVISIGFALGQQLATTPGLIVHLSAQTISETRTAENVLAEKPGIVHPDTVVMAGAHLDSVVEGPGINDNGSGSSAILEIATQLAKTKPWNTLRFALWGAEESGLLGSIHYVDNLSEEELDRIGLYLNFDMIGSPNFVRFVYDGDSSDTSGSNPEGSGAIEQVFLDYFGAQGLPTEPTEIGSRSDHAAFRDADIPIGGLFTGAEGIKTPAQAAVYGGASGIQYDPCYHQACDTFANVSLTALDQMSDAAAHAIITFAMDTSIVTGERGKGNVSTFDKVGNQSGR